MDYFKNYWDLYNQIHQTMLFKPEEKQEQVHYDRSHTGTLLNAESLLSNNVVIRGIAHDINNMLSVIKGYLELIETSMDPEQSEALYLQRALGAATVLRELNSLFFSDKADSSVCRNIQGIFAIIRESAEVMLGVDKKFSWDIAVAPDTSDFQINCLHLKRIIQNLIQNAKDAMPDGGRVFITMDNLSVGPADNPDIDPGVYVRISIRDEGKGIDKNKIKNLFRLGYTTKKKGSGLGLRITEHFVHLNNGRIEVSSEKGEGTTFRLLFPAVDE